MRRRLVRPHWDLPGASFPRALRVFAVDYPTALRLRVSGTGPPPADWTTGDRPPVVLIPGVYEPWWYLRPIGAHLHARGHPVIPVPTLHRNTRPIAATAERVAAVLERQDLRGVIIVAHSKGGIVGKHLMVHEDPEHRVERMVAIASPFQGSGMASYMLTPALRAFRTRDAVIRALDAEQEINARITSVYPVFDPHIPEGSRLRGARNVPLKMGGHFTPLLRRDAIEAIVGEVERPSVGA